MAQAIVTIDGFLSKDAVLRFTQSGVAVLGLSIPVTPQKKVGNQREDTGPTQWYDCSLWGSAAEMWSDRLPKGTRVELTGVLTTREHEGKTYQQVKVRQLGIIEKVGGSAPSGTSFGQPQQQQAGWGTPPQQGNSFADEPPF